MSRSPGLSKSRFQAGLQCPKSLWLRCHRPDLADPLGEGQEALFQSGHRVGELARLRFPGGVLVTEDFRNSAAALRTTERLLAEGGVECLYEAAFSFNGVFVRPDVLRRRDGEWELCEVKSSASTKPEHLTDVAIQAYVLLGSGLPLSRACVMHLNREYVYAGGAYQLDQLFALEDVTAAVWSYLPCVPGLVAEMKAMLSGSCPEPLIGGQCRTPYDCGFIGYCHAFLPEHPVTELPRISAEVLHELLSDGICAIADIPRAYPGLSAAQRTVCEVVRSGRPRFAPGLAGEVAVLQPPVHFLDFETFRPALPVYPGTRPYQVLPVQWSCHTCGPGGSLEHQEFLHREPTDPRRPFAESLVAALSGGGPIVVYTGYENSILTGLASDLPDLAEAIAALQARLFDLAAVIRTHVQHPGFHGRTSLKYVLPALVDDLSYEGLAVSNGETAMLRYEAAVLGDLPASEREAIFGDLLEYCATDTLAMVRLVQVLRDCAGL
jgi:hypothetical protein